jgi:hypothetical protein
MKVRIWFGGFYEDMERFYGRAERLWIDGGRRIDF